MREYGPRVVPLATHDKVVGVLLGVVRNKVALAAPDFDLDVAVLVFEHVFPVEIQLVGEAVGCLDGLAVTVRAEHVVPEAPVLAVLVQIAVEFRNYDLLFAGIFSSFFYVLVDYIFTHTFPIPPAINISQPNN